MLRPNNKLSFYFVISTYNEQPRLSDLCAFALFTVRWANLYQPHVRRLIPKVWTHNWAKFHYIRVAMSTDGVFGSRSAVTSYLDVVFDRAFNNSAEFLSNDPLSSLLGWCLHKNRRLHDGRLNSLKTSFFYGSSNQALWNIRTVVSPSGIDTEWETSQEFLPPPTQLITKCKIRTKITRKIKRSKQSHSYCDCQASYIGETGRNLSTRLTEHKRATRNGDVNNHIAEHHLKTKHQIDWDSATCITYSTDYYQRLTLESWFTNLEQTPLNRSQQLPAPYKRLIDEIKQN